MTATILTGKPGVLALAALGEVRQFLQLGPEITALRDYSLSASPLPALEKGNTATKLLPAAREALGICDVAIGKTGFRSSFGSTGIMACLTRFPTPERLAMLVLFQHPWWLFRWVAYTMM